MAKAIKHEENQLCFSINDYACIILLVLLL